MYEAPQVLSVVSIVLLPFICIYLYLNACSLALSGFKLKTWESILEVDVEGIWFKVKCLFAIWMLVSIVEIFLSKGLPFIWLLTGSPLNYVDFGIHSLHGLLNSMLLACSLFSVFLFYTTGERKFLVIPIVSLIWGALIISRALILSNFLQILILYVFINGLNYKKMIKTFMFIIMFVVVFGVIGDFRTEGFKDIVSSDGLYPDYMPSGFLWVYVYMMTPLNNLANIVVFTVPVFDWTFPNTVSLLFPSVIRDLIFASDIGKGELVLETFNISTAYAKPFIDYGVIGMVALSTLYAVVAFFAWRGRTLYSMLAYVIIAHCLLVSIFFNWLFSLPIVFQFVWIYFILYKMK